MMNGFAGLIINENMKIYRRLRTWVFAALMLLVVIVVAVVVQQVSPQIDGEWREQAEGQLRQNEADLSNIGDVPAPFRESVREGLEGQNTRLQYHINENINPYERNSWYFVNRIATEIIPLAVVFVIITASSMVAGDFSSGTIKMMLVRPHHRWSILFSKFISAALYSLIMLLILFAGSWLVGSVVFGFGGLGFADTVVRDGQVVLETASINTLKILGLEWISMLVLISMTFMLAVLFRSNAIAIAAGIFIGYVVSMDMVLAQFELTKYLFVTNLDLTYYLYNAQGKVAGTTFSFSLAVITVYTLVFMTSAWWVYQKRDVAG